ncbi:unnamed protein product [Bursaphelenchus okinawaensis]|uniref:Protein kinase domain-containing protein n=1 Tax=Bursaphelenchus okinawaensis TaxID=465554 RepID=A0A811KTR2_9BILA|nr:unnamed protein product [Bursaphelenchus okinawaensis]CAG9111921.1 unnamed protein product [Bursaphelenchus okinawaensis]
MTGTNKVLKNVAVKNFKDSEITAQTHAEQKEMMTEISSLSATYHVNIIQFYGVLCDVPPIKLVMEFCPGGSLGSHLLSQKDAIKIGERILYLFEAARGMEYLEGISIVHRDLAARNCLIAIDTTLKIGDFGLSLTTQELSEEKIDGNFKAPIRLLSPETIGKKPLFSHKSDVWAYGMLCWEIFNNGQKPWPDDEVKKIARDIKTGKMPTVPNTMPPEVKAIVKACWNKDPESRPSFWDILHKLHKLVNGKYAPPPPPERSTTRIKGVYAKSLDDLNLKANSPKGRKKNRRIFSVRDDDDTHHRHKDTVSQQSNATTTTTNSSSGKNSGATRKQRPVGSVNRTNSLGLVQRRSIVLPSKVVGQARSKNKRK